MAEEGDMEFQHRNAFVQELVQVCRKYQLILSGDVQEQVNEWVDSDRPA